ncbi:hypothetical protein [Streptomyces niveus]|uniref:hypothetical protein n=1 Tax=Streptomyces niveus TaxID=193462 RepID=UPI00371FDE10|nr:hypothetical protein OG211_10435 [Streptomyces niveus]
MAAGLTGCSGMFGSDDTPETREVDAARADAVTYAKEIREIIDLPGKLSDAGPQITPCGDKDFEKFYSLSHTWSLYDVPVADMEEAMLRLKGELPAHAWKIESYGPDSSRAKSLKLTAKATKKKYSLSIRLLDRRGRSDDPSMIYVALGSACFQVPEGTKVDI